MGPGVGQAGGVDVVVVAGPGIPAGATIPGALLRERFSRSSGPGGQSVNTADSRVELELTLGDLATVLTASQHRRLSTRLATQLVDGRLVVTAQEHRQQRRNRVAARERMAQIIRDGLRPPPPVRRATTPSRAARERRLETKRLRSRTKARRAAPGDDG